MNRYNTILLDVFPKHEPPTFRVIGLDAVCISTVIWMRAFLHRKKRKEN